MKSLIVLLLMLSACEGKLLDCTSIEKKSEQVQLTVCLEVLAKLKEIGLDGKFKKEGSATVLSVKEESNSKSLKTSRQWSQKIVKSRKSMTVKPETSFGRV